MKPLRHWGFLLILGTLSSVSSAQQAASGEAKENAVSRSLRNRLPAAVVTLLEQADQFELLSLNPKFDMRPFKGSFHGYKVLAKTGVKDTKTRQRLISALLQGMRENSGNLAACFNPRHGIRAIHKGSHADLVICFECLQFHLFGNAQGEFLVSRSPQSVFDAVLKAADIREHADGANNEKADGGRL